MSMPHIGASMAEVWKVYIPDHRQGESEWVSG
jgi:hypothetical protein